MHPLIRLVDPQSIAEGSNQQSRVVRYNTIDAGDALLFRLGLDLSKPLSIKFHQSARECPDEQPPTLFCQSRDGLRFAVSPAESFESFSIKQNQPLRTCANDQFRLENRQAEQVALGQSIENGVDAFQSSVFCQFHQATISRRKIRIIKSPQVTDAPMALHQGDAAGHR